MKYKKTLLGLSLSIVIVFVVFFGLHSKRQALRQNEGADLFSSDAVSSQIPTGNPRLNSRRVANENQQSTDPWVAYVEEKIERLYQEGLKNSTAEVPADFT